MLSGSNVFALAFLCSLCCAWAASHGKWWLQLCISLALPPSAHLLTLHGPSFPHSYILWGAHLKGAFPNTNYVCRSTHAFNLWLFEARVSAVFLVKLQSGPVMEQIWLCHTSGSTSIMHYYCEDNGGLGLISGIPLAFVENVYYQSLTCLANEINYC